MTYGAKHIHPQSSIESYKWYQSKYYDSDASDALNMSTRISSDYWAIIGTELPRIELLVTMFANASHSKCREISWDLVGHFEWRYLVTGM